MKKILRKFKTAVRMPLCEKCWFVVLYPLSGVIELGKNVLPFAKTHRLLGTSYRNYQLSTLVTDEQLHRAWRIGRVCALIERTTPWPAMCLVQAQMARMLLGYYRIPYVIHLGARIAAEDDATEMKAHAWVKVGPRVIAGAGGLSAFGIVGTFVAPDVLPSEHG
ncbi:Uncharacterised protein [BD1-7 clade bacterium]|uniref:Microcin J25-processing protein McjB C-terminal domain-containing protein n=1 Tax=BD1-7 clade bacterium TaxID=2029982 RepID=A0A5S9MZN9_9GAMM|nr:Uncharacterised protein [BD1-7 clade bacterium]CAA0082917.1 Uncharacterised protein [BD1-7 clade bacterium]